MQKASGVLINQNVDESWRMVDDVINRREMLSSINYTKVWTELSFFFIFLISKLKLFWLIVIVRNGQSIIVIHMLLYILSNTTTISVFGRQGQVNFPRVGSNPVKTEFLFICIFRFYFKFNVYINNLNKYTMKLPINV